MGQESKQERCAETMWFKFMDMYSGGGCKTEWEYIYVQASDYDVAVDIFERKTGRNAHNVTCSCCGPDFSISYYYTLDDATEHERHGGVSVEEYCSRNDVLVIEARP